MDISNDDDFSIFILFFSIGRIQTLEEKIENTRKLTSERKNVRLSPMEKNEDEDSSYGSEEEFDEYIDWRSKRSFK